MQHSQFQALSSCEAIQMQKKVGEAVLKAYETGMNVILQNYSGPITDLLNANANALQSMGFQETDGNCFAGSLVKCLRIKIAQEEAVEVSDERKQDYT